MSSLNRADYEYLFLLGQRLFYSLSTRERKEIATILMAMSESVIGQQFGWPTLDLKYKHLNTYPPKPNSSTLIKLFPKGTSK